MANASHTRQIQIYQNAGYTTVRATRPRRPDTYADTAPVNVND